MTERRPAHRIRALLPLVVLAAITAACGGGETRLVGTDLGGDPAPAFALTDHRGQRVALSDLRGKVVTVAFLYTVCPDVCPIIASKLADIREEFGERATDLAFVAISVDPERDTAPAVRRYLAERDLEGKLLYLTGTRAELQPVWRDYGIAVVKQPPAPGTTHYEIGHVDALYIIDRAGRKRSLLQQNAAAGEIARDIRALLEEPPAAAGP